METSRMGSINSTQILTRVCRIGTTRGTSFLFPPILPPIVCYPSRHPRHHRCPHNYHCYLRAAIRINSFPPPPLPFRSRLSLRRTEHIFYIIQEEVKQLEPASYLLISFLPSSFVHGVTISHTSIVVVSMPITPLNPLPPQPLFSSHLRPCRTEYTSDTIPENKTPYEYKYPPPPSACPSSFGSRSIVQVVYAPLMRWIASSHPRGSTEGLGCLCFGLGLDPIVPKSTRMGVGGQDQSLSPPAFRRLVVVDPPHPPFPPSCPPPPSSSSFDIEQL